MKIIAVPLLSLVLAAVPVVAQPPAGLDISAFADLVFPVSPGDSVSTDFQVNQAEIDLDGTIAPGASAAMAVAYDPEAESFSLAVLSMEMILAEAGDFGAGLTVGKFDVPFGIDYKVYASVDRRFITSPVFLDFSHRGWNDLGLDLEFSAGWFGGDIFLINGDGCGRGDDHPGGPPVRPDIKRSWGSRLHFSPWLPLEIGFSGAIFHDQDDVLTMALLGADFQARAGGFLFKGEYLRQNVDRHTQAETDNEGFYVQGMYEFGQVFLLVRYDQWTPESATRLSPERVSLGGGYILHPGLEFRLEHDVGLRDLGNSTLLQMVMSFGGDGGPAG